ncbi:MAG: hypothetical protein ACRBEQ_05805 [Hyphomonas sp.]
MEAFLPIILSAVGGTVLGPIISKVLGGSTTGGLLGGVIGGVGAHFGLDAASIEPLLGAGTSATNPMNMLNSFLEGGAGGGVLGLVSGFLMKGKKQDD